jgi:hypothetical protein
MDRFCVHKSYSTRYFATISKEVINYVHSPSYVVVLYIYVTVVSNWKPNFDAVESDRPHHDPPTANVTAQQDSSASFVSLRFYSRAKEFWTFQKCPFLHFYFFLNCVCLKLRNLDLCKSGSIRTARGLTITRSSISEDIEMPMTIPYLL